MNTEPDKPACQHPRMARHQESAAEGRDAARLHALSQENAVLLRELGRIQQRCTRALDERAAEIRQLRDQLGRMQAALDSYQAAADLVICQTGCISHNDYWRVKDHCRRTGIRCVFLDDPDPASLMRCLDGMRPAGQDARGAATTGQSELASQG